MLDEISKALAPWPLLQYSFTVILLIGGVYAIIKGMNKGKEMPDSMEDKRAEWLAYEHLRNIEENSFKMVELLRKANEEIVRLTSVIWNDRQGIK